MKDFIDFIIPIFMSVLISSLLMFVFFDIVILRIEKLEKYHNICSECGQVLHN